MQPDDEAKRPLKLPSILDQVRRAAERERLRRSSPSFRHPCPFVVTAVKSSAVETLLAVALILNAWIVPKAQDAAVQYIVLEQGLVAFFLVEILVRVLAHGWVWFLEAAHFADVVLVLITSVLPRWPVQLDMPPERLRALRLLRLLSLLAPGRMLNTFFYELFNSARAGCCGLTAGFLDSMPVFDPRKHKAQSKRTEASAPRQVQLDAMF
eukprot:gnl/TRDRNA2_/TRDRNA2_162028_c0_seq1.p1 gnl/TRDRNA2_/TRDRNA2_162028_c0~~gnl/TRDRNA2_/TRDRNA2_162028_c0_seq1.p1  ORF type:complete len:210 (-),score=21.36 gnl/TRDRNA2_/TRDRNA2_162028_c0_seq1:412-1041(-)